MLALLLALMLILNPIESKAGNTIEAEPDSFVTHPVLSRRSWFLIPIAFYQEETSVGFGATFGYYFKSNSLQKISSCSGSVIYTVLNQAKINFNPRFYSKDKQWYFTGNVQLRYYPDKYYGIGNMVDDSTWLYTSMSVSANFQPFWNCGKGWQIGPRADVRAEKVLVGQSFEADRAHIYSEYGETGWSPYCVWGLGAQVMYDGRDNQYYPYQFSSFFKFGYMAYLQAWGSDYTMHRFSADFRQYVPTALGQVFAWQLCAEVGVGDQIPFEMLPALGGSDLLRGFRERRYTDNSLVALQAEYRIPVYGRLKAVLLAGVGDVFDVNNLQIHKLKVGYGGGLRFRLNDARVHLRVDLTGNNYGEFKFYITATEAF